MCPRGPELRRLTGRAPVLGMSEGPTLLGTLDERGGRGENGGPKSEGRGRIAPMGPHEGRMWTKLGAARTPRLMRRRADLLMSRAPRPAPDPLNRLRKVAMCGPHPYV